MGVYCLGTSYASTVGLNLQYALAQRCLEGRLLEPEIPYKTPNLTIADIPCGTCIWLIDMAKEVDATTKLEGFDLNLGQGPPESYLASNISLARLDMLEDPPGHLHRRYDVIHVRFVVCFVDDEAIDRVLRSLLTMLKPGGYLQWLDASIAEHRYESAIPGYTPRAIIRALDRTYKDAGWTCPKWVREPETHLTSAGFEQITIRRPETPPYVARAFADLDLLAMMPIATTTGANGGRQVVKDDDEVEDFAQLVREAAVEVVEKQVGCFPVAFLAIARKPI